MSTSRSPVLILAATLIAFQAFVPTVLAQRKWDTKLPPAKRYSNPGTRPPGLSTNNSSQPDWGGLCDGIGRAIEDGERNRRNSNSWNNNNRNNNRYREDDDWEDERPRYSNQRSYQPSYNNRYPSNNNYYSQPAATYQSQPAPSPVAPKANVAPVVVLKPTANPIKVFKGRPITSGEIKTAEERFNTQIADHLEALKEELHDQLIDPSQVIATLTSQGVDPQSQTQILQAVESGNATQVQILWATILKDQAQAQRLYQQVTLQQTLDAMAAEAEAGSIKASDIRAIRNAMTKAGVPQNKIRALTKTFTEMEEIFKIREILATSVVGSPNAKVTLPVSTCMIVWNPEMREHDAISLGGDKVMVGTGGRGILECSQGTVAEAMGIAVRSDDPIDSASYDPISDCLYLMNPATSGVDVHFAIGSESYQLGPGQTKILPGHDSRVVNFHRGGTYGRKKYTLTSGAYKFTPTTAGWELYKYTFEVTIDNADGNAPFNYVLDNKGYTVEPGQTKTHTSSYPILVRYDRGDNSSAYSCYFNGRKEVAKVAINSADNLWSLFPAVESVAVGDGFVPAFGGP